MISVKLIIGVCSDIRNLTPDDKIDFELPNIPNIGDIIYVTGAKYDKLCNEFKSINKIKQALQINYVKAIGYTNSQTPYIMLAPNPNLVFIDCVVDGDVVECLYVSSIPQKGDIILLNQTGDYYVDKVCHVNGWNGAVVYLSSSIPKQRVYVDNVVDVNLAEIETYDELNVNIKDMPSSRDLKVEVTNLKEVTEKPIDVKIYNVDSVITNPLPVVVKH